MSVPMLDPRPVRPLTSREMVKVLMCTVGGLAHFCDVETLREAVRWISETDDVWEVFRRALPVGDRWAEELVSEMRGQAPGKKEPSS